jgi:trimeric autotransporter adhesin
VSVPTASGNFTPTPLSFGDLALGVTSTALMSTASTTSFNAQAPQFFGSISGPNASDFTVSFSDTGTHISRASVTFSPSGLGARTATLVTNLGNIALSGNGIPDGPSLSISSAQAAVSQVGVSVPVYMSVGVVENNGSTSVTPTLALSGPNASDFALTGVPAGGTLVPTQTIFFNINFIPSQAGVRTATLTATDTTSGFSKSIPLSGTANPMAPSATPSTLTFGSPEIGTLSAAQTVMVSAPNGDPVSFQGDANDKDFPLTPGTCATQTPCQISISFKPSTNGFESDQYIITDLVTTEFFILKMSGSGGVASVSLSSSSLNFAGRDIGTTSIPQTVTLTNTGDATLTISGITFAGANIGDFPIESNTRGSTLASGANCTIGISFDPTASGMRTAVLQIISNAASSPDVIQLSGTAN